MMSGHVRPKKSTLKSFMYLKTIRHHPVQFPFKVKVAGEMGSARPLAPLLRSQRPRMRVCLNVSKCCQLRLSGGVVQKVAAEFQENRPSTRRFTVLLFRFARHCRILAAWNFVSGADSLWLMHSSHALHCSMWWPTTWTSSLQGCSQIQLDIIQFSTGAWFVSWNLPWCREETLSDPLAEP